MPRYNVQLSNNLWAVWSTIVDDWVTDPMTFHELVVFRRTEAVRNADRESESLLTDKPEINKMTYDEWKERFGE